MGFCEVRSDEPDLRQRSVGSGSLDLLDEDREHELGVPRPSGLDLLLSSWFEDGVGLEYRYGGRVGLPSSVRRWEPIDLCGEFAPEILGGQRSSS
jgi:hypothetical protein